MAQDSVAGITAGAGAEALIGMAGAAVLAYAAALGKRDHDPRAGLERLYVLAHFFNHAREFVSQDCWHRHVEANPAPVALP